MNVSLTPQLEHLIRERVASGRYNNASEVVRDAIRQMKEHDRQHGELLAALAIGEEQIARGETVDWTPTLIEEKWQAILTKFRSKQKPTSTVVP